ncbi:MAG: calcium/sodium antiporter [Eubacterium sp.]|nr:calcium/sodium antiporter [Eubacterium sp.]
MELITNILFLVIGFILLIKGADFFVDGSASVARYFKVPGVIIGLTIVAMGTSAPELAVSVSAGLSGSNEIAVSNVVGSNIFNLLMVLGVCAVMKPLPVDPGIKKRDFPISLVATLLVILLGGNLVLSGKCTDIHDSTAVAGTMFRWNGLILVAAFVLYLLYTIHIARKNRIEEEETEQVSMGKSILLIAVGLTGIILGGQLVVNSAKTLAAIWGMSETLIGLTIVAIGTSLPELVTSIVASSKGQNGMAIGNVVGSNIFNLLLILGVSGSLHPIVINVVSFVDLGMLLGVSMIAYAFVCSGRKINRVEGAVMILLYAAYTAYAVVR